MNKPVKVFMFTALACEAKPFIEYFSLKKQTGLREFCIYRGSDHCLAVTGVGKAAMAAGVAYTLALIEKTQTPVLLNLGIAGHQNDELGKIYIAHKIIDEEREKNYYPQLVYSSPCPGKTLLTVAQAQHQYRQDCLYDMEASAFYETAIRFTSSELVQCLKVISDNRTAPCQNINPKQVSAWLDASIPTLAALIQQMDQLAQQTQSMETPMYQEFIQTWHFTVSEKIRLQNLLLRWQVINSKTPSIDKITLAKGKEVLLWLEQELESTDYFL